MRGCGCVLEQTVRGKSDREENGSRGAFVFSEREMERRGKEQKGVVFSKRKKMEEASGEIELWERERNTCC